jgi:serine/threonine protein kinase
LRRVINRVGILSWLELYVLDLSKFEDGRALALMKSGSHEVSVKQCSRVSDGLEIVVKSFDCFNCANVNDLLYELFLLTQLKHRCIAPVIGIVLPTDSTPLQTATLYYRSGSLEDVLDKNAVWWTPTTKAKAIAGIALGMQSAHRHGVVHGSLKPNNILFDEDHHVHIVDIDSSHFRSTSKETNETNEMDDDNSDEMLKDAKNADVFSFASVMFYILVGRSSSSDSLPFDEYENQRTKNGEVPMIPGFIPKFVRKLIANGWSADRSERRSFESIIEVMKRNDFKFAEGVGIDEVLDFVDSVERSDF